MLSNSTTNLFRTEYYDDYYTPSVNNPEITQGEENDFHRILFRPRMPVQSRELTQLQTILQAQLERFGKSAFRNGEAVLGGGLTLDTSVTAGKVLPVTNLVSFFSRTTNAGKLVFDSNTVTTRAHILQFASTDEGTLADNYLIFKYLAAGTFSPGTVIQAADDAQVTATFSAGADAEVFSTGSVISIDEGIFFVSGFFVRVKAQTIVLNPFSTRPSFRIGLEIAEDVIDELDDVVGESLLDPANQNAPGAHRFRISLTLAKRSLASSADTAFIELCRVVDGVLQKTKQAPRFVRIDELNSILARRTFDEAGDYIVRPFTPVIEDDPDTEDHFVLSLGPGKAYVRGFEAETTQPTKLQIRKGRASETVTNRSIPDRVGNFVYAVRVGAASPTSYFANTGTVDIHCVNIASVLTTSNATYNYSKIGSAKVRMIETFSVPSTQTLFGNNSVYKLFFYDVAYDSLTGNLTTSAANALAITLQVPIGNGFPIVNGAIEGATIILGGASSPVTGTYTVNNYSTNTTVAFITLREFIPTLPNGNTTYKLLFQQRDIDAFALYDASLTTAPSPLTAKFKFQAEVDVLSKQSGTPVGNTVVSDTNNNGLVFQIPEKFVVANTLTTNTATFTSWVKTSANAQLLGATNANFTITVSGTGFTLPVGALSAAAAQQTLVIFDQTADANGRGQILQFTDAPGSTARVLGNVSIAAAGADYNITFRGYNLDSGTTRSLIGFARTTVVGLTPRQKTLILGNTTHALANTTGALNAGQIEFHTLNAAAGFAYSLKTSDVFRISKVLYLATNSAFANTDMSTARDVTEHFTLDDGQRDNAYEYSRLIAKTTASSVVRPTGRLLVIFDWFSQSGRGYITLDSYLSSTNVARGMTYDTIPSYTSAKFGRTTISLRDVLDFRPARSNFDFTAAALVYAASDASSNTTYLTSTGDAYLTPVSDEEWLGSYSHYLSRYDKIALGYDGAFIVIEGQDAVSPKPPAEVDTNLLMFQLRVPAYTLVNSNGVPTGVVLNSYDHKRFTMQDLSKVEDRVAHLEYYTALNSLERITRDQSITDESGNERFKNGILVDGFHGGDVADVSRADYTASIDSQARELRTAFRTFVMQFAADTANSTGFGVTLVGDMAIPSYTERAFISQTLATHAISVNPFDVASFYGTVKLVPAVDIWKDTSTIPAQVIDLGGPSQSWINANMPSFVSWGEWEQTWSGVTASHPHRAFSTPPGWTPESHAPLSMTEISWNDVETSSVYERQGTTFEYEVTSTTASLGSRVVDTSIVHFCRERDIIFSADGLKPGANIYPFFDGTPMIGRVQQAAQLELEPLSAVASNPFYIGQTIYIRKAITGLANVAAANTTLTGNTNSRFDYELVPGTLVRVEQGVNSFDNYISRIDANNSAVLANPPDFTFGAATVYALTPVTVCDVAARYSDGNIVTYTLKVARAVRDVDTDTVIPYPIVAGNARVDKQVNDSANTTSGAVVLIQNSPRSAAQSVNIVSAIVKSGVARAWNGSTGELRLDNDISDDAVATIGTVVYIVAGPAAGQNASVLSYNAATQTVTLNNSNLDIVPGQSIYSIGTPKSDGFVSGGLTSGRAGTIAGVLHLPGATFAVGTRNFRLTDSANNVANDAHTSAETTYEASGLSTTLQETSVTSRSLGLRRLGPASESLTLTASSTTNFAVHYVDPLAETFLVDATNFPQGVFVTSLDLCFAAVPDDDIPITVQLRPVVNGYPASTRILPCVAPSGIASVTLRPDQVRVTTAPDFDNPQTISSTRFTFPAPVHLLPGTEYAIVVISDSDSYEVYTAVLGQTVIGSTAIVAKQPYAGSFFKSQNAQTWTESPFEDLAFRLNRASWDATETTPLTAALVARAISPIANATFDSFEFYPHEVQFSDSTNITYLLDIKPWNANTDDLTSSIAVRYTTFADEWSMLATRSMVQGYGGSIAANAINTIARPLPFTDSQSIVHANTVDASILLTTYSADVAPFIDLKKLNLLAVRHLIHDMGVFSNNITFLNPGVGYLANLQTGAVTTTAGSPIVTGDANTNFVSSLVVGDSVVIGGNVEATVFSVTNTTQFIATANIAASRSANTFYRYGGVGANNNLVLTFSGGNGTGATGYVTIGADGRVANASISAAGTGYTETPTITIAAPSAPGGDYTLAQTTAVLNYNSELAAAGGNGLTRYITRPVTLADGFDARDITVTFDAYRPSGSKFYVYYKILPGTADTDRFEDQPWRLMDQITDDSVVSSTYYQFKEFQFKTPNGRALDASTDTTDKFKVFAIKLVMATSRTTDAPRVMNFRAIALDT